VIGLAPNQHSVCQKNRTNTGDCKIFTEAVGGKRCGEYRALESTSGDQARSGGQQATAITLEYKGIFPAYPGKRRILNRIMAVGTIPYYNLIQTNT